MQIPAWLTYELPFIYLVSRDEDGEYFRHKDTNDPELKKHRETAILLPTIYCFEDVRPAKTNHYLAFKKDGTAYEPELTRIIFGGEGCNAVVIGTPQILMAHHLSAWKQWMAMMQQMQARSQIAGAIPPEIAQMLSQAPRG